MSDAPSAPVSDNAAAPAPQAVEETPGHKVFAGNLAYSTTDEGLKSLFEGVSTDITSAQVIQRGNRSAGYGFVSFASLEAANKAVTALNQKEFEGRVLIVEIAKPTEQKDKERSERRAKRRAGRRGSKAPPGEVTEAEANGEAADKPEGAATDASAAAKPKKKRNLRKKVKKTKRQVTDAVTDATTETPATNGDANVNADATTTTTTTTATRKRIPRPQRKRVPRPVGEPPVGEPSKTVLFVANLGFTVDDAQLSDIFTSNGITVVSARVVRKRWGTPRKSKGYGFVDVGSEEQQNKALETLQGKVVDGRELAVKIAVNAQDREEEAADAADNKSAAEANAATPEAAAA